MQEFQIAYADVFRRAETYQQTTETAALGLMISGLDYMQIWTPDGKLLTELNQARLPVLNLLPRGCKLRFQYGAGRENWVILGEMPGLHYEAERRELHWQCDGFDFEIPFFLPVALPELAGLRQEMAAVCRMSQRKLPRDTAAAELRVAALLARFLEHRAEEPEDAAARFKSMIDRDTTFQDSLIELSHRVGASTGYLRKAFQRRYQLDPGEYRTRLRLQEVMRLIAQSRLSLKEIADQVGMRHVTHLNALIRQQCRCTPGELLRRYRTGD